MTESKELLYNYLGRVSYTRALNLQEKIQDMIISGKIGAVGVVLFLYHDPVITTGKYGDDSNLLINKSELKKTGIEYVRTSRGGDATYHGPGQLVCYPIINLKRIHLGVRKFIESLEDINIEYLYGLGIQGRAVEGLHGVWVGKEKIASIGVRVKRHVTMHGFALNLSNDLSPFGFINPCGMEGTAITSVKELTGTDIDISDCQSTMLDLFVKKYRISKTRKLDMNVKGFTRV